MGKGKKKKEKKEKAVAGFSGTVDREKWLSELEAVQPGLSPKGIIDQSNAFVFQDGRVLTFNDIIGCHIESSVGLHGAVGAQSLLQVLKKIKSAELQVSVKDGNLLLVHGKNRVSIHMDAKITLPVDNIGSPTKWKDIPDGVLDAVEVVVQCAGTDERTFILTCVHLHPERLEATDNVQACQYSMKTGVSESMLVGRDSLKHIVSLGMTQFSEAKNWLHFRNPMGMVLSCRRYAEKYPELTKHFKQIDGDKATLPAKLEDVLDVAAVFSSEHADDNRVKVTLEGGKMKVHSKGVTGQAYSDIPCKFKGDAKQFRIRPQLFGDIAKRFTDCIISKTKLAFKGKNFRYICCLGAVEDGTD